MVAADVDHVVARAAHERLERLRPAAEVVDLDVEALLGAFRARVAPFNVNYRYVEEEKVAGQNIEEGFDAATVTRIIKLIDRSEYKRRQAPPGLKVTSRAFGSGRFQASPNKSAQI